MMTINEDMKWIIILKFSLCLSLVLLKIAFNSSGGSSSSRREQTFFLLSPKERASDRTNEITLFKADSDFHTTNCLFRNGSRTKSKGGACKNDVVRLRCVAVVFWSCRLNINCRNKEALERGRQAARQSAVCCKSGGRSCRILAACLPACLPTSNRLAGWRHW